MPAPATDRQRLTLAAVAVLSVTLTALSLRTLHAAAVTGTKPIPAADVARLSAYLAPLPDSTSLAVSLNGTMVGQADPFGWSPPRARNPRVGNATGDAAAGSLAGRWVVSSILFEGSRRSAIVNDAWVKVGDSLEGGARVTAIERKFVVVTDAKGNRQVVPIQDGRRED